MATSTKTNSLFDFNIDKIESTNPQIVSFQSIKPSFETKTIDKILADSHSNAISSHCLAKRGKLQIIDGKLQIKFYTPGSLDNINFYIVDKGIEFQGNTLRFKFIDKLIKLNKITNVIQALSHLDFFIDLQDKYFDSID